jgi:hypothetical protein
MIDKEREAIPKNRIRLQPEPEYERHAEPGDQVSAKSE